MAVTRDDVARAAGVSSAVVSYVLNDGPRPVAAATRQRVLDAIAELGYRPNSLARSMKTRTTNSIGLVLPVMTMSYFAVMTQQVTEVARRLGLSVVVATSNGRVEVERAHVQDLADRRVDGVILMSVDPDRELSWTASLGMPVLLVDRPTVPVESTRAAVAHLLAHGRARLGRLAVSTDDTVSHRRDAGWAAALDDAGLAPDARPVARASPTMEDGYRAAVELLCGDDAPDAVVVDIPTHAYSLTRAAADLGVRIPEDLAVVSFELGSGAAFTVPRITSVDSPLEEIAEAAVARIREASPADGLLRLSGEAFELHARESCGPH